MSDHQYHYQRRADDADRDSYGRPYHYQRRRTSSSGRSLSPSAHSSSNPGPSSVYHIRNSRTPSAVPGKPDKLVFTTTSLRNVVLADRRDRRYYEVRTPPWERHRTRVGRMDAVVFEPLAELLNGHAPVLGVGSPVSVSVAGGEGRGPGCSHEESGKGELKPVDEFLHVEEGHVRGREMEGGHGKSKGDAGADVTVEAVLSPTAKGKQRMKDAGADEWCAWFRAKDGKRYTWHAGPQRLELICEDHPAHPIAAYYKEKRFLGVLRISQYPYLEVDPVSTANILDQLVISFLLVERLRRERNWS
ncbi:uncharacterized protein BXZ73DRAFT_105230 [Epithele typhae]|uniref:uncharacterized protein n=1 Tax=Epithele typhae TaxID=378194 RepID=UPI002007F7AE|nr:uncharacterized protein BXZ73DRAFT_105230 [Epithele typhae]KAH9918349.1 hypothetical protein BXZ73DRAFT_105230 [Epithele typhae]